MTKQEKLEAIRTAVIMACHPECETYEEAYLLDCGWDEKRLGRKPLTMAYQEHKPITIDRIAQIIDDKHHLIDNWRLSKDGSPGTLESQSEELQNWIFDNANIDSQ